MTRRHAAQCMVTELRELATSGLGILLLSHDLDLVRALAARVVVLSAGQVIASGGTDVLPTAPELAAAGTMAPGQPLLQAMNLSASLRPRGRDLALHEVDLTVRAGVAGLTRRLVRAAHIGHPSPPPVLTPDTRSEPRR